MFCPKGFRPVCELPSLLPASAKGLAYQHITQMYGQDRPGGEWSLGFLFDCTPRDYFEIKFFEALKGQIFICSPKGEILRFDATRLFNVLGDYFLTFSAVLDEIGAFSDIDEILSHFKYSFMLSDIGVAEFSELLEEESESISIPELAEEHGILSSHQKIPMFYERIGYTISLIGYDIVARTDFTEATHFQDIARIMRPFEGWSLCVPEDFVVEKWADSFRMVLERPDSVQEGALGRPSTVRTRTMTAYQELFPRGHEGLAWLEVMRAVNDATGLDASVDTLKRALRNSRLGQKSD